MSEKENVQYKLFVSENTTKQENALANTVEEEKLVENNPFIMAEENEEYKRLEKEFNEYKRKKVLSRIDSLFASGFTLGEIKEDFRRISNTSKGKVVVLPCFLDLAKKELPKIVSKEVIVDYPFAGMSKNAVLSEIKTALRKKADVSVAVSLSAFASGDRKPLDKVFRILKKQSKGKKVTPMFSVDALSQEQVSKLSLLVKSSGFKGVKFIVSSDIAKTADAVKLFYELLGERCPVEAIGKISKAEDAETLFNAGADRIITTDFKTLKRQRLDGVSV